MVRLKKEARGLMAVDRREGEVGKGSSIFVIDFLRRSCDGRKTVRREAEGKLESYRRGDIVSLRWGGNKEEGRSRRVGLLPWYRRGQYI